MGKLSIYKLQFSIAIYVKLPEGKFTKEEEGDLCDILLVVDSAGASSHPETKFEKQHSRWCLRSLARFVSIKSIQQQIAQKNCCFLAFCVSISIKHFQSASSHRFFRRTDSPHSSPLHGAGTPTFAQQGNPQKKQPVMRVNIPAAWSIWNHHSSWDNTCFENGDV